MIKFLASLIAYLIVFSSGFNFLEIRKNQSGIIPVESVVSFEHSNLSLLGKTVGERHTTNQVHFRRFERDNGYKGFKFSARSGIDLQTFGYFNRLLAQNIILRSATMGKWPKVKFRFPSSDRMEYRDGR